MANLLERQDDNFEGVAMLQGGDVEMKMPGPGEKWVKLKMGQMIPKDALLRGVGEGGVVSAGASGGGTLEVKKGQILSFGAEKKPEARPQAAPQKEGVLPVKQNPENPQTGRMESIGQTLAEADDFAKSIGLDKKPEAGATAVAEKPAEPSQEEKVGVFANLLSKAKEFLFAEDPKMKRLREQTAERQKVFDELNKQPEKPQ